MSDDAEPLPGAVGSVVMGGNRVESEAALEFSVGFLLGPSSGHEEPEVLRVQTQVGGHNRVLVGTVVGREEIELIVLPGLVVDLLPVTSDREGQAPLGDLQDTFKARDAVDHRGPTHSHLDDLTQAKRLPHRHLHGKEAVAADQEGEDFRQEEGRIEAQLQRQGQAELASEIVNEFSEEDEGSFAIVDVAGAVLDPQDLRGLGEVGQDGIVTGHLAVVRIATAEGPGHGQTRRDHRAVDIDRQPAQAQLPDTIGHEPEVEAGKTVQGASFELPKPAAERAFVGQALEPSEALHQRILSQEPNMTQPSTADEQKGEEEPDHVQPGIVAAESNRAKSLSQTIVDLGASQIAQDQLETGVRSQTFVTELDGQISIDTAGQSAFS